MVQNYFVLIYSSYPNNTFKINTFNCISYSYCGQEKRLIEKHLYCMKYLTFLPIYNHTNATLQKKAPILIELLFEFSMGKKQKIH